MNFTLGMQHVYMYINTFAASYLNTQGLNNSCLKSPASTLVDLTFQSHTLRSFSLTLNLLTTTIVAPPSNASKWQMGFNSAFKGLNQLRNLSL